MAVCETHARVESRIVFHVKYTGDGLDASVAPDFKGRRDRPNRLFVENDRRPLAQPPWRGWNTRRVAWQT